MSLHNSIAEIGSQGQLDSQRIALLRSLRNGALLPQLLRAYRDQAVRHIEEIRTAMAAHDHDSVRLIAHTLKSASYSVGATRIGDLCARLEANARQPVPEEATDWCGELDACYAALMPELDAHLIS